MPDGVASLETWSVFGIRYRRHVSTSPLLDAAQLAPAVRTQCLRLLARP
jgi:hypothetical protein